MSRVPLMIIVAVALAGLPACGGGSGKSDNDATAAATSAGSAAPASSSAAATTAAPESSTVAPASTTPVGVAGDLPDGVYRVTVTDKDLDAVHVLPEFDAEDRGTYTVTLKGGEWSWDQVTTPPAGNPHAEGTYVVDGDEVQFYFRQADAGQSEPFTWKADPKGALVLTSEPATSSSVAAVLASHPLAKVG